MCREKTGKAKSQLELKLDSVVADNTKRFFKGTLIPRGGLKKTLGVMLVEGDHPTNGDEEKVEAFNVIFLFPKSLIILTDLEIPGIFNWRTISVWEQ